MEGRESQSDGETESASQKDVSSEYVVTSKLKMLAKT